MRSNVRAIYAPGGGGQAAGQWAARWGDTPLPARVAALEAVRTPLLEVLDTETSPGDVVLEAGCGSGQYVSLLRKRGRRCMGLDFARPPLVSAFRSESGIPLVQGLVTDAPFPAATFDAVVSLGVIEHFVEGPDAALADHMRVLRPEGVLILTVPRLSPLKRFADARHLRGSVTAYRNRRGMSVTHVDRIGGAAATLTAPGGSGSGSPSGSGSGSPSGSEQVFYQYEIEGAALRTCVEAAGFRVERHMSSSINFDAVDTAAVRRVLGRVRPTRRGSGGDAASRPAAVVPDDDEAVPTAGSGLKGYVLDETPGGRLDHRVVSSTLQRLTGHINLVVARRP